MDSNTTVAKNFAKYVVANNAIKLGWQVKNQDSDIVLTKHIRKLNDLDRNTRVLLQKLLENKDIEL